MLFKFAKTEFKQSHWLHHRSTEQKKLLQHSCHEKKMRFFS